MPEQLLTFKVMIYSPLLDSTGFRTKYNKEVLYHIWFIKDGYSQHGVIN